MGRPTVPGIFRGADGWEVDKIVGTDRLRHRGAQSYAAAESWLDERIAELKGRPAGSIPTFDQAAAQYLLKHEKKVSLDLDVYLLGLVVPFIGPLPLDRVDDDALEPFVKAMQRPRVVKKRTRPPLKTKSINLALEVVRRILNLAARSWRVEGKPWLPGLPPLISMLDEVDARAPRQLSWAEQREHLPKLASHLARMALFDLNTGIREEPLCNLRWEWEARLDELGFSVFVVPARYVKGRKAARVVVCNSVAQSIIESCRGEHPEFVFVYTRRKKDGKIAWRRPVQTVNNNGWQKWRARCGLQGFRVHDMRHTVGMRLREAGVSQATRSEILWHAHEGMTEHYSVAQVLEIRAALELITSERHAGNVSLASLIAKASRVPAEVPASKVAAG